MFKKIALAAMVLSTTACTWVDPGHVGLRVDLLGSDKGSIETLPNGRYWEGINEKIYQFPTFQQNQAYKVSMQVEGVQAVANIGVRYRLERDMVSTVFTTYRKGMDELNSVVIKMAIADAGASVASTMRADDLISAGKEKALRAMEERVRKSFEGTGIVIENLYWSGSIENLPDGLTDAVNSKIQAQQDAITRQNQLETEKGQKEIEKVKADTAAYAVTTAAKAEAEAIRIKGKALSENPAVVELEWINKWNGVQPQTMLGDSSKTSVMISR